MKLVSNTFRFMAPAGNSYDVVFYGDEKTGKVHYTILDNAMVVGSVRHNMGGGDAQAYHISEATALTLLNHKLDQL